MKRRDLVTTILISTLFAGCLNQPDYREDTKDPAVVSSVDLERYAGRWYEIARYPNSFEDKKAYTCVGVTADYALREDGKISVTNTCRKDSLDGEIDVAEGVARSISANNAKLKVRFAPSWIPFAEGDYWVLHLDDDYTTALVGDPNGKYLWILARTPTISPETVLEVKQSAARLGYETPPLKMVLQPQ